MATCKNRYKKYTTIIKRFFSYRSSVLYTLDLTLIQVL